MTQLTAHDPDDVAGARSADRDARLGEYKARLRPNLVLLAVAVIAGALLFVLPPVGFLACMAVLVIAPPWGRSLIERGLISLLVALGIIAIAFPRGGSTPITITGAHALFAALTIGFVALRFIPQVTNQRIPRPTSSDWLIGLLAVGSSLWLMSAYIGKSSIQIVSGLFFTGWDNQGHFTTFANTYEVGSTLWPTVDGSVAWNQWYPSLHTTFWSLSQLAFQRSGELVSRIDLLFPYVQWTALSFAISLAALAFVAADLTKRLTRARGASIIAICAFAAFALFGSPTLLFNAGFNNFMIGVAVVVLTGYLSARNWRSARHYGWFLLPLGALAANALWTPLVLGLAPSAVIVTIALWRWRTWTAPVWAIAAVAFVGGIAYLQTKAVVAAGSSGSTGGLLKELGSVGQGMVSFNIGMALAAPVVAIGFALLLIRARRWPVAVAVAGPVLGFTLFLAVTVPAARSNGLSPFYSYYVLKNLDAMLLAVSPLLAALAGIGLATLLVGAGKRTGVIVAIVAAVIGISVFGYVGPTPKEFSPGFSASPGIAAGQVRAGSVENSLVGEAIINAQQAAQEYPDRTTLLWDGAGTLPNLWVSSLHHVMSKTENEFYAALPQFPYDDTTVTYVKGALTAEPTLNLVVLWFRGVSGPQVAPLQEQYPTRVTTVQVPMRSSALCQECHL